MTKLLRLCCALALACGPACAVDWTALKPQGYVSDFANVIDAQSKAELENYCTRVEQQTGVQMAMVTIESLSGEPIEDVANAIYRAWGVGKKGKDEGIMLLLSVGDRRDKLEVGYGLEPLLPDGFDGEVLRAMRPALRQKQYGEAMRAAAATIGSRIAQAKGVTLDVALARRFQPEPERGLPWGTIITALFVLFFVLRGGSGRGGGGFLPGLLLGSALGGGRRGGWSSGSDGGFGGGDSGGGFGGFGGGDSGGGGASSDW